MLTSIFLGVIIQILNAIFFVVSLGQKITTIPFADSYLVQAFSWWNSFLLEIPPLQIVWHLFLLYLSFEIALLLVKLFLGHRVNI